MGRMIVKIEQFDCVQFNIRDARRGTFAPFWCKLKKCV
jgi:hypothetical protein